MGKGTILSDLTGGQYSVKVDFYKGNYDASIAALDANLATLATKLSGQAPGTQEYDITRLQIKALEAQKTYLEDLFAVDRVETVWCADFTEGLTGDVSTVEVPGESTAIQIYPGYDGGAAYDVDAGQLEKVATQNPWQAFYNMALLPGWQKWKPTFRYGTISNTDKDAHTCDVAMDAASSTQQGLGVNQSDTLVGVPVEYMTCNAGAFADGDEVLVAFDGQDWGAPRVVGFKESPKPCNQKLIYIELNGYSTTRGILYAYGYVVLWDIVANDYARDVVDDNGDLVASWPVLKSDIGDFLADYASVGEPAINQDDAFDVFGTPGIEPDWTLTTDECTEYYPNSEECRAKTVEYTITGGDLSTGEADLGYEIASLAGSNATYYSCFNTLNCFRVQGIVGTGYNYTRKIEVESLTNDATPLELISYYYASADERWNGNAEYQGMDPVESSRQWSGVSQLSVLGDFNVDDQYNRGTIYEPGGDPLTVDGLINHTTEPEEDGFKFVASAYGDGDAPFTVLVGYVPSPRFKKVIPPCFASINPDLGGTVYYCRRADTNEWQESTVSSPVWAAEDDEISWSGRDPEAAVFVSESDGLPVDDSPFDAIYNLSFSNAVTTAIKQMMTDMQRPTPEDNFILQSITLEFLV